MKVLHVHKSEPDEIIKKLASSSLTHDEVRQYVIYNGDVDYDKLIELVFEYDKIICWW